MTDAVVELSSGFVRGVVLKHEDGFNYYAFKGIPYAEPPIDKLRFQDPVPKRKWTGILDCKEYSPIGFQFDLLSGVYFYNEDVVNVNVFTHKINDSNANRPVMVYIHGGDYSSGTANDFYCGPDYLIRKNIVLVTVNFRIGILGFLDTEDEISPGNQGLKDLVLSLQWVQQNIAVFGGDPDNVTIFGASSGAANVHYLALSPLSKGLMHKAISQNNSVYAPWMYLKNPKSHAIKICSILGKNLSDSRDIVEFLRTVDSKTLAHAQQELRKFTNTIPFGPGVDSKSPRPFMPVPREQLADEGVHIPYLMGFNSHAGLIYLLDKLTFTRISREDSLKIWDLDFEKMLLYNGTEIIDRYHLNSQQMRRLYFKNEKISNDNIEKVVEIATDVYFAESVDKLAKVQAEKSSAPTYLYHFSYDVADSISKASQKNAPSGVGVYDELPYLFKLGLFHKLGLEHVKKGTRQYKMMEQLTEMWTNFATYGRPTITTSDLIPVIWKPITDGMCLRYLNIDEDITMQYCINREQKFMSAAQIKA